MIIPAYFHYFMYTKVDKINDIRRTALNLLLQTMISFDLEIKT